MRDSGFLLNIEDQISEFGELCTLQGLSKKEAIIISVVQYYTLTSLDLIRLVIKK